MANFRKSFNFRNGVQVDEDNFVVSSTGLVGIGTSIPTAFLDIRGTTDTSTCLNVVGLATVQDAFIGFGTVQRGLEVGITSFYSGIITAKSGIVTYYGDARYLQGMPTSQWVDIDAGLGYTSIYAAGNVGVGTVDPRFTFQVGGNNNVADFTRGVGINSSGDVIVSGIATITKMYGWGIGVTGLNAADAIATGTLDNDRLPSNINKPTGIVTFSTALFDSLTVTNPITALGGLVGTASTAEGLSGTPNLNVGIVTTTKIVTDSLEVSATGPGITTIAKLLHVGTGGTALASLEGGRLGIGTALPSAEIQIRKSSGSSLDIVSETGESKLNIGQQTGVGNSIGVLRFGNTDKTLDIINKDTGNINMYLHGGAAGINTGRFEWLYGQTNNDLMSLTYDGKLGIGNPNPDETLHVVGTSTVTENAFIGQNLYVGGSIFGTLDLPDTFQSVNVDSPLGIGTFFQVNTTNAQINNYLDCSIATGTFSGVGIGTTNPTNSFEVRGFAEFEQIGIGTTSLYSDDQYYNTGNIQIHDTKLSLFGSSLNLSLDDSSSIGFGTYSPRAVIDLSLVNTRGASATQPMIIIPRITNAQKTALTAYEGAIIYNTSVGRFQGYTGVGWTDFHGV